MPRKVLVFFFLTESDLLSDFVGQELVSRSCSFEEVSRSCSFEKSVPSFAIFLAGSHAQVY